MYCREKFGVRPSSKACFSELFDTEEEAVKSALRKSCVCKGSVWMVCIEEEVLYICYDHQIFKPITVGDMIRQCRSYYTT